MKTVNIRNDVRQVRRVWDDPKAALGQALNILVDLVNAQEAFYVELWHKEATLPHDVTLEKLWLELKKQADAGRAFLKSYE